ncbi:MULTISPECIES: isochorismatase family cysteine hydrolase [unclassified Rhizobium]|uniref:isochorismatase family cysteine hydrolase n=1 Tax=unclassified Rhizobium TaxID=2613769 RepID=UPI000EAA0012|nr:MULTISPECIES: isochorismatase family cysteine hydrolase [unclassified Rhizobium]AYG70131.1 cysteine hydrolase [Rhizobium sp. CCGE531]AYG76506.1 cysteine hydrolase [Rhizobium sp. CCGE532]
MTPAPLSQNTLHVVIDMQRLFAEETAWHTPAIAGILPNVVALSKARPAETLFARFAVPQNAEAAKGRWKDYYRRWSSVTLDELDVAMLDLVAPLAAIASPSSIVDKGTYSIFGSPAFAARLQGSEIDTLIFSGVETDVCVYASALDAVDAGYRVILAEDALASGDMKAHAMVIDILAARLTEQIEILSTKTILNLWRG